MEKKEEENIEFHLSRVLESISEEEFWKLSRNINTILQNKKDFLALDNFPAPLEIVWEATCYCLNTTKENIRDEGSFKELVISRILFSVYCKKYLKMTNREIYMEMNKSSHCIILHYEKCFETPSYTKRRDFKQALQRFNEYLNLKNYKYCLL